jgi:T-complex protein 1 subunit eta
MSIKKINEISVKITKSDKQEQRQLLEKCAQTTLSSKLVAQHKEYFAKLVVDAVMLLDDLLPLNMIGIKKVSVSFGC